MLKHLDISYNRIESVQDGSFFGLNYLLTLNIQHNQLEISKNMFKGLTKLETLNVDDYSACCSYFFFVLIAVACVCIQ